MTTLGSSLRTRSITCALVILASLTITSPAFAADKPARIINVSAESSLKVTPDMATLSASLWERTPAVSQTDTTSDNKDAVKKARDKLEKRTATLIKTLESAGIKSKNIRAGSLNVNPEYLQSDRDAKGRSKTLVRTQITRRIQITIDELDKVPQVLDALTDANINQLGSVQYGLLDPQKANDQALKQALQRAKQKAGMMADSLGVDLGDVLSINESGGQYTQPKVMMARASYASDMASESAVEPEYRSGEIEIEAGVEVSWEID